MQQEVVVYITGIHPTATRKSVHIYCKKFTGEISKVEVFVSSDGRRKCANVSVLSYTGAFNLIYGINYTKVDGQVLYANICGYDVINIQNEELFSIFISGGNFTSERELYEELSLFGQVFRVKLLRGCAVAQFYNEESMNRALNARYICNGKISKKTSKQKSIPQKIEKDDTSVHSKISTQSKVSSKSRTSKISNSNVSYISRDKVGVFNFEITRQSSTSAM